MHSFIATPPVQQLGLLIEPTPKYMVEVGTGHKEPSSGVCRKVNTKVQGVNIQQPLFLLQPGGVDIVLGMEWISSLGWFAANFELLILIWLEQGELRLLRDDPKLSRAQASWKTTLMALKADGEGYLITPAEGPLEISGETSISAETEEILEEFDDTCHLPQGLPPARDIDHAINLKEGAAIPHIRPYRYPHFQKDEIEKIINEMMTAGIIRPSVSPYSSPVILVKKKDGGWRFCVDYRALNKVTIPGKFPIPVIDELLDEVWISPNQDERV